VKPRPPLPPGPYLVVGLARSGNAVLPLLDDARGWDARDGGDGVDRLEGVRTVVKSPGVPREAPVIAAALARGIEVVGELEIAWRLLPNEFVAVTGTNGKTTTVELLGAMHRAAGAPVAVAGNVGTPLSSLVGRVGPDAVVVCECSSFQLEDTAAFAPECAVLLNLEPDHLDRHGGFEGYREAKLRVFANQGPDDVAVVPAGFEAIPGEAARVEFSIRRELDTALRGEHNLENAAAAVCVARTRGLPREAVYDALRTFDPVPHRLEDVAEIDGVTYVNDSKATNVASAVVAIHAFEGGVHVILGGRGKGEDYGPLRAAVEQRCRAAYLIGEEAGALAEALAGLPIERCGDLGSAVRAAAAAAQPGEVVLLSPGAASYDQFTDFEERGAAFRAAVTGLAR